MANTAAMDAGVNGKWREYLRHHSSKASFRYSSSDFMIIFPLVTGTGPHQDHGQQSGHFSRYRLGRGASRSTESVRLSLRVGYTNYADRPALCFFRAVV